MNKKRINIIISLILTIILLCTGCNCNSSSGGDITTDKYFMQDGVCEYYLVLAKNPQDKESYATQEFNYFFKQATDSTLPIITEDEVKSTYKYISIGNTKQFENVYSGVDLSSIDGTQSAYFISNDGYNIYIKCSDDFSGYGCLYGIYDLLHDLIGYTYYSDDEVYVEEDLTNIKLNNYDKKIVKPSIDQRTLSTFYNYTHDTYNTRLRFINFSRGKEWDSTTNGHGQLQTYCNPNTLDENGVKLCKSHPKWFEKLDEETPIIKGGMNENQLCWTAHGDEEEREALLDYCADKLEGFIEADKDAKYFMFGQEDSENTCTCEACQSAKASWGGTSCGLQVAFTNDLIDKVEKWLKENDPIRAGTIDYVIYAYKPTQDAPVKEVNGQYVAYSDKVIPNSQLRIMLCPVTVNFSFTLEEPVGDNPTFLKALKGWNAIASGKIFIYTYCLNIQNYFNHFYNFSTVKAHYTTFQQYGASYVLSQGISDTNMTCLQEMRNYCEANIMWNTSLNYDDLAEDFIKHYFKQASDAMFEYYTLLRDRFAYYYTANSSKGTIGAANCTVDLYTYAFVTKLDAQITKALEAISILKTTDPELYKTLYDRIIEEDLSVIYLKMYFHSGYYSESEIADMKEIWDYYTSYFGITSGGEGAGKLPDIFK